MSERKIDDRMIRLMDGTLIRPSEIVSITAYDHSEEYPGIRSRVSIVVRGAFPSAYVIDCDNPRSYRDSLAEILERLGHYNPNP